MRRHTRVAMLVAVGFALILVSAGLGTIGGPAASVTRPAGLLLGVLGLLVFFTSGLLYTVLFVRSFLRK